MFFYSKRKRLANQQKLWHHIILFNVSLINVEQTFQFATNMTQTESSCYNSRLSNTKMERVNVSEMINQTDVMFIVFR